MNINITGGVTFTGGVNVGVENTPISFTLTSADFTNTGFGYGAEGDNTTLSIGGNYGSTEALWYVGLQGISGGNPLKSAEILNFWNKNNLTLNGNSYLFDVGWGPDSSTNTARNVVILRFDYNTVDDTALFIGTVDTNNTGWDTSGHNPYNFLRAANGTFKLPATFTLIRPLIQDGNNWC